MDSKKIMAALLGAALFATSIPAAGAASAADEDPKGEVVFSTDFEDGDVSAFSKRGDRDTTVLVDSTEQHNSGTHSMKLTKQSSSWNGPSLAVSKYCEPNKLYTIQLSYFAKWYSDAMISFQYTDSSGVQHYSNLQGIHSDGKWTTSEKVKFSYTDSMKDPQIYVEQTVADNSYIDDVVIETVPEIAPEDIPALKDVYKGYFKIGTAITNDNLANKSFMNLVEKHFNESITAGNEMKPDSVLQKEASQKLAEETGDDTVPAISFSAAEGIINYCVKNNIPMRAHTLVWHSQTPDWFFREGFKDDGEWVSKEKMLKRMENYIKLYFETLAKDYPDLNIYACDVVNEAWTDGGTPREPAQDGDNGTKARSAWVKVFGDNSFIEPAFTYARKYAPKGCKLFYNDYNEYVQQKRNKIVEMATDLKAKGLIDGIGMQSHLDVRSGSDAFPSLHVYEAALEKFSATGLELQITELDATTPQGDASETAFKNQADYYSGLFDLYVKYKDSIDAVILWGVTDDLSWRANKNPLLFDKNFKAKPAYYSITDDVPQLEKPDVTTTKPEETTTTPEITTTTLEVTTTTEKVTTTAAPSETTTTAVETTATVPETTTTAPEETTTLTTTSSEPVTVNPTVASKLGDVNADGICNISDVVLLNKSIVGAAVLNDVQLANSDTDGDGKKTSNDSVVLLKYIINLIEELPYKE